MEVRAKGHRIGVGKGDEEECTLDAALTIYVVCKVPKLGAGKCFDLHTTCLTFFTLRKATPNQCACS